MLKIKTYLDKSSIIGAGTGLFAAEFIPKDTIIWEFNSEHDKEYTKEEIEKCNSLDKQFLSTYTFVYDAKYYLCIDNARFFNHSNNPNCYSEGFDKGNLGYTRSKRDIDIGEELTDDYKGFGLTEEDKKWNIGF